MNHVAFTSHGRLRVNEKVRTRLTERELELILINPAKRIPIGKIAGTDKVHYLFYSPPDLKCLIAIFGLENNEIISILELEYEREFYIMPEVVRALSHPADNPPEPTDQDLGISPFTYGIRFYSYLTGRSRTEKLSVRLGKVPRWKPSCRGLECNPVVQTELKRFIKWKQLRYDRFCGVWLRLQKNKPAVHFNLSLD